MVRYIGRAGRERYKDYPGWSLDGGTPNRIRMIPTNIPSTPHACPLGRTLLLAPGKNGMVGPWR